MNKWTELAGGLILLVLALYLVLQDVAGFQEATILFFKGGLAWTLGILGLLLLLLGITDLKG
jgi:hypothetical protein